MAYPPVIVVDENDQEIGLEMLSKVWEQGLRHRMVRIMAEDAKGRILLQKRAEHMVIFPGCWDNSAAGHVDEDMSYSRAAIQEVTEELGIVAPRLEEVGKYYSASMADGRIMNNFSTVYRLRLGDGPILYEPEEVQEVRWFTPEELESLVKERPQECTAGLVQVAVRYYCKKSSYVKVHNRTV